MTLVRSRAGIIAWSHSCSIDVTRISHPCHQKDKKHRYYGQKRPFRHAGDNKTRSFACVLQAAALLYEVNNDKRNSNTGGGKRNESKV